MIENMKNRSTKDTKISALKIASEGNEFVAALTNTVTLSLKEGVFPQCL